MLGFADGGLSEGLCEDLCDVLFDVSYEGLYNLIIKQFQKVTPNKTSIYDSFETNDNM